MGNFYPFFLWLKMRADIRIIRSLEVVCAEVATVLGVYLNNVGLCDSVAT